MTTHQILGGALALQVALAAITWWPSGSDSVQAEPLVPGGANGITKLEITPSGDDAEPVVLTSQDGEWLVQGASGYPADADKVGEVLDALGSMKLGTPIASSATSHDKLKVGPDAYDKRVTITTADGEQSLWIGAAASKALHLRRDGEDEVYKVKGLSAYTLKDRDKNYLPPNHAEFDKDAVSTFALHGPSGDLSLTKRDGRWLVDDDPLHVGVDSAIADVLDKASRLRLDAVVGTQVTPDQGLTPPALRLEWSVTEGDQNVPGGLVIGAEKDGKYYAKTDDSPFVILTPSYRTKDLLTLDLATLIQPAPDPAEATPGP